MKQSQHGLLDLRFTGEDVKPRRMKAQGQGASGSHSLLLVLTQPRASPRQPTHACDFASSQTPPPHSLPSTSLSSSKCSDAVRKSSSIEDKEQFVSSSTFKMFVPRWSCRSCTSSRPIKNLLISKMMQLVLFGLFPLAHWTKQISDNQGH